MANKTFIPALEATVGDWKYYICMMKYAEVARQVSFAHELGGNRDLGSMIQRGISDRTKDIVTYLKSSEHRFLGALIIAAWGGQPDYLELEMADPENMLKGVDRGFGVLTFDGTQQYFALDGQHRLSAIKEAIKSKPELGSEDIAVLIVSHYETEEGRERTRRLFTNINRNAKVTTAAENIALDEDDGYSVITRRLLEEHPFASQDGRVKVFQSAPAGGDVRMAGNSIAPTDKSAWSTIVVVRDLVEQLWFPGKDGPDLSNRPSPEQMDEAYDVISGRIMSLLEACGNIPAKLAAAASARDVRAPKGAEASGQAFMRPVIQKAVARVLRQVVTQGQLTFDEAVDRLKALDWEIGAAPWIAVYNVDGKKMIAGKDFSDLLLQLLHAHIAPASAQAVRRARRDFKTLRSANYPVSEGKLLENLASDGPAATATTSEHDLSEGE